MLALDTDPGLARQRKPRRDDIADSRARNNRLAARGCWLSRAALAWERLWPALWPVLCVARRFSRWRRCSMCSPGCRARRMPASSPLFAAFAGAAIWGRAAARSGRTRSRRGAASSSGSGLAHRPLAALADRPSAPLDGRGATLWAAHQRRMAAAVRRLRVGWPAAGLARRDPWGLRAVLAILLLLGAIDAGADWRERLVRAVTPGWDGAAGGGGQLRYLADPARIYRAGAAIPARRHAARCACRPAARCWRRCMAARPCRAWRSTMPRAISRRSTSRISGSRATLTKGKSLTFSQGGAALGNWPIEIVPDNPPTVAFAQPPKRRPRAPRCGSNTRRPTITGSRRQGGDPPRRTATRTTRSRSSCRCPASTSRRPRRRAIRICRRIPGPGCRSRSASSRPTRSARPARASRCG